MCCPRALQPLSLRPWNRPAVNRALCLRVHIHCSGTVPLLPLLCRRQSKESLPCCPKFSCALHSQGLLEPACMAGITALDSGGFFGLEEQLERGAFLPHSTPQNLQGVACINTSRRAIPRPAQSSQACTCKECGSMQCGVEYLQVLQAYFNHGYAAKVIPVSYTHLTLPTICSV